ncbi:MAG: Rv1155 class probable F420-dependent [Candidatus Saccharibacteria bacterium]|nr:Rv1155 class probable F420-dependent [Candidatus Saccharibacteria bacterium]
MKATALNEVSQPDISKIFDFLDSHPVGVLATVDETGAPDASTIFFSCTKDLRITFTTKRDTRKHENISRHSKVILVAYDAESQTAVQVRGRAHEETDEAVAQAIYHGTLRAARQTGEDNVPPIAKIAAGPYVAYFINIETVSLAEYGWGDSFANAMEHANDPTNNSDPA